MITNPATATQENLADLGMGHFLADRKSRNTEPGFGGVLSGHAVQEASIIEVSGYSRQRD